MPTKTSMAKPSKTASKVDASDTASKPKPPPKTIGQRLPRPNVEKVGDVLALPLSNGSFAYARIHFPVSLGVLALEPTSRMMNLNEVIMAQPQVAFFVEYCLPVDHPEWIYLGKWKFVSFEESKSPPYYIQDIHNPNVYHILDNGTFRSASREETKGLQKHGLKDPEEIKVMIEEYFKK